MLKIKGRPTVQVCSSLEPSCGYGPPLDKHTCRMCDGPCLRPSAEVDPNRQLEEEQAACDHVWVIDDRASSACDGIIYRCIRCDLYTTHPYELNERRR